MRRGVGYDELASSAWISASTGRAPSITQVTQVPGAYLNIIGGLTLDEPAADLAAILALASSYLDKPIGAQVAAIGEVGLTGELRNVNNLSQRLSEVRRLGFTECIIPKQHGNRLGRPDGLKLTEVQNVGEALRVLARS